MNKEMDKLCNLSKIWYNKSRFSKKIVAAVEKYAGVMEVTNETEGEDMYFVLTIML